jgi:pimeloyl-ACP methyl ester carboxylesterase
MKRLLTRVLGLFLLLAGAAAFLLWTPDTDPAAMRAKYGSAPSQFVDVGNGLTVHFRDEGPRDAPVILLLHGSNADLHTWDPWAKALSSKYRVVRFDQIGHGLTGPNPAHDYGANAMVATTDAVATKLGLKRFVIAGNSMGGWIAWQYAIAHPDKTAGLVLIDAGGAPVDKAQSLPIGFRIARTPVLRDAMLYFTPRSLVAKSLSHSVSNQAVVTDATIDRYWELLRCPGNRQATIDRFAQPFAPPQPDKLATIRLPTLILWGEADKLLPVSGAKWFATHIAGSKTIIYPGIGHLPMEETADKSAADLANWLATLPSPR